MARVFQQREILAALPALDLIPAIEAGFVAYSDGRAVVPPVGELVFERPPGDAHIKYGYLAGDDVFVIKVATGFYDNPRPRPNSRSSTRRTSRRGRTSSPWAPIPSASASSRWHSSRTRTST